MTTNLGALMDAMITLDRERFDEIACWAIALEGTELGDALSQQKPMTIRLCAAQTYAFLAIQNDDHMPSEMIDELIAAANEACREIEED